jgi:hypothetical protein
MDSVSPLGRRHMKARLNQKQKRRAPQPFRCLSKKKSRIKNAEGGKAHEFVSAWISQNKSAAAEAAAP